MFDLASRFAILSYLLHRHNFLICFLDES